jgi:hypothetical protein
MESWNRKSDATFGTIFRISKQNLIFIISSIMQPKNLNTTGSYTEGTDLFF